MPELPDVARFEEYIKSTALHQTVRHTSVLDDRILYETTPQGLGRALKGESFKRTMRRGKFLFVETDSGGWLVLHFGMTAYPKHYESEEDRPRFSRVVWEFENGCRLAYVSQRMLGRVGYAGDLQTFIAKENVGPDALDGDLDADLFADMLTAHRGMIRTFLMDQSSIAGIGNVWADEILFQSRLHPEARREDMDKDAAQDLFRTIRRVFQKGLDQRGVAEEMPDSYLIRHRRKDGQCPSCGGELKTCKVSQRTSWYCPKCQG